MFTKEELLLIEKGKPARSIKQVLKGISSLGVEVKISPKSLVCINEEGYTDTYGEETISVNIGIGNDHVASLVMSVRAWEALKSGEKLNVKTHKAFIKGQ